MAAHGPLRPLDERLDRALTAPSGPGATLLPSSAAEFFADLGNMTVALPVLAAVVGWVAWRERGAGATAARRWLPPLAAAVAMAAVPALVAPAKALVDRPGPPGPSRTAPASTRPATPPPPRSPTARPSCCCARIPGALSTPGTGRCAVRWSPWSRC
ncbi:integral membrane protein [Streptomyces sparsogenes DSM 40356]|uniref:Integral membrane protein n=1 Tax=Streptomyces sparsogenes DSM 40356 TaxID=1331668 RepID=A0A1R1SQN7_9ACTN|nr:integral membrane protein [Streptomyces sparsogenes DSM 40356]